MAPEAQQDDGRKIRWAEIQPDAAGEFANALEDIYDDRLDAIVLRQAFPADATAAVLQNIDGNAELPWRRPNRTGPSADIRILGLAATPSFECPRGPGVDEYFDNVDRYENVTAGLFSPEFSLSRCLEDLLGRVSGKRPVERLVNVDGRPFALCTVRSLPEGQGIILHNDHGHIDLPMYAGVNPDLDSRIILSFFAVLQAPQSGGRLVMHGVTQFDSVPQLPGGYPDSEAIKSRYQFEAFELRSRDAIIFGAGKFYHHVEPVGGPRPRVTLGSFLAFSSDRQKLCYWN